SLARMPCSVDNCVNTPYQTEMIHRALELAAKPVMLRAYASLLAVFCTVGQCRGQGTLRITFDGPPVIPPGAAYSVTNYYESGMSFRPVPPQHDFSRVGVGYPSDPQDGTAYLSAAFTQSLMFSFTNGSVFDLVSVDLAEYSTGFQEPVTVHFVGSRHVGTTAP